MNTMMTTIQDQDVKQFIEIIKVCKSDGVLIIQNDYIYSTNILLSYMKSINTNLNMFYNENNMWFTYDIKQLVNFVCSKNLYQVDMDIYGNLYVWLNGECKPVIIINNMISPNCIETINRIHLIDNTIPDKSYDNINNDSDIIALQSSLSKDGLIMYKKDGYMMSLYKGLLPINKSDLLALSIYNEQSETLEYFTSRFTVSKKKFDINVYLKFRYL